MLRQTDRRGLVLSSTDSESLQRYEEALASVHSSQGDGLEKIEQLLARDPGFIAGYCLRAAAEILGSEAPVNTDLGDTLAEIDRHGHAATDRERRHAAAARAWFEGNTRLAAEQYGEIVVDYPRDSVALQVAHALDFRLGQREMLRDRIAQVLPYWDANVPGYGYILGMYAFGLEENGEYARARRLALRSLALEPSNASAIHVIAHVMEMQGRTLTGIDWLKSKRAIWAANKGFAIHIAWHLALFYVDLGRTKEALEIYDEVIAPSRDSAINALVDASALLWRLDLSGVNTGARWQMLAGYWRSQALAGRRAFTLVHAVMAFAATRHEQLAEQVSALLRHDVATRLANVDDDLKVALPLAEALQAFGRGDYSSAVDKINAVRVIASRCGGSVAQCDVIHLTLTEAAIRSQRESLARALAAERSVRKPDSPLNQWLFARIAREAAVFP